MRLLVEKGLGFTVGFRHVDAVFVNLLCLRGIAFLRQLVAVKHMHPGMLLGELALAALIDMEVLYRRHVDRLFIPALLRQQRQLVEIAVVAFFEQLRILVIDRKALLEACVGVFEQLLIFEE